MNNIEALRQLSQHCKRTKCENCELNEVSASETARFCLLRKQPSDWPGTPLFRHLVAGSEKKGKKKTSDCIACALAEECDIKNLRCKNFLPRRKNEEQDCAKCLNYQECVRGVDIFMFECASFKEKGKADE